MSAVLDTVRSFSETLANELASAVIAQDRATVETLDYIAKMVDGALQAHDTAQRIAEETFHTNLREIIDTRNADLERASAEFRANIDEINEKIHEVRGLLSAGPVKR